MSISAFRRASAKAVGRPYKSAKQQKRSALARLVTDRGIGLKKDDFTAITNNLAQGISRGLRTRIEECMKAEASGVLNEEMASLAAGTEDMPTLAENDGYRYSCRRACCRLITLTDM